VTSAGVFMLRKATRAVRRGEGLAWVSS